MRYFILLIAFALSSCINDNVVNKGWIIYDLTPLHDGRVIYFGHDSSINKAKMGGNIEFVGYEREYNIGDSVKIVKIEQHGR